MIIYILCDNFINKIYLPKKVDGSYPIVGINDSFLGNIEENNGKWILNTSKYVLNQKNKKNVEFYDEIFLKDEISNLFYSIYAIPLYENKKTKYVCSSNEIIISSNSSSTINFSLIEQNSYIKLAYNLDKCLWFMETNLDYVVVNNKILKNALVHCGDYIFYRGLKLIFVGKKIISICPKFNLKFSDDFVLVNDIFDNEIYEANIRDDIPLYNKDDYFFKAPRFDSVVEEEEIKISSPPVAVKMDNKSIFIRLAPQLTMLCASGITISSNVLLSTNNNGLKRTIITSIVMLITMSSSVIWPLIFKNKEKKENEQKEIERKRKYTIYLEEKNKEIENIKMKQRQILIENLITSEQLINALHQRNRILWQRNIEHHDFLELRLGIGRVNAKIKINVPDEEFDLEGTDNLFLKLQNVAKQAQIMDNTPQSITLTEDYILAVVGDEDLKKKFIDNLFLQIMILHSYSELKIIVYTENEEKWNYLKIIPHCWNNSKSRRFFATTLEEMNIITSELEKMFENRIKKDETEVKEDDGIEEKEIYKNYKPYYLIFTDNITTLRNNTLVKKILKYKKNLGFSILIDNNRLSTLPSETTSFIIVDKKESGLIKNELSKETQKIFNAEYMEDDIYKYAELLANIPIVVEKGKYELPSSLSFLEMFQVGKVEQLNISERWVQNNPAISLAVPVGVNQDGELFKMNIHENESGPHGLIAGTTGSGKSEWIITYILSLAVNFHPDEVQFVLIDYKGGGLALSFENEQMGIKLPHLAGTITNLDKSAINRSIASIESELKRRQAVFNETRERLKEGSMNIYKYQELYRKKLVDEPMSHLIIISDEFAELKAQQPEFMEQLISISRIGRSLGVHLILATQKPSGVVNEQIWSNSKFKICLKVQSTSDSNEILKRTDAAYLKQTGSFYLAVGTDEFFALGQSAWAGAKYYPKDILKKNIDQSVQQINNIGDVINSYDDNVNNEDGLVCKGEELLNIVQHIDAVGKKEKLLKRQLWLPNVSPVTYLSDLLKKYSHEKRPYFYNIAIGEYDEPRRQEQGLLELKLNEGNIGIIGQIGSGKEKLVSTIMWSSIIEHTPYEINFYVIDLGAETLKKFSKFPHVGEVFFQSEPDKILGIFDMILQEQENRKNEFSEFNGSFDYYNKVNKNKKPLIVVVLNGIETFESMFPKLTDTFVTMYRDGPRYGIVYIIVAVSQGGIRNRNYQYFNKLIVLQLQDEFGYRSITNCRRGLVPANYRGRGIIKLGDDDDSYCEFQTTNIIEEEKEYEFLRNTANKMIDYYKVKAKQIIKIPENITSVDLKNYINNLNNVPIGYNFYEKDIATYDFAREKINLITFKNIKECLYSIYGIIGVLGQIPNIKLRVIDLLNIYSTDNLDIKVFNDNLDVVFAAVEKDVLTRTELQEMAVNVIIGIGNYNNVLSSSGKEIFQNMFENIINSNKQIFILIDDYSRMKNIKVETWYGMVNNNRGLWLGAGLNKQNLIATNELNSEDRKIVFDGLAYKIEDAKYSMIKSVMDGVDDGL